MARLGAVAFIHRFGSALNPHLHFHCVVQDGVFAPAPAGGARLILTPLQLIDRLAALVPPPRVHRHRYFGVLAPNSPLRPAVTAMALPAAPRANSAPHADEPAHRRAARYAWALLLARIYEVFPLRCPTCGGDMRIIAFITEAAVVRDILLALKRADSATHHRPGPRSAAVGSARRCSERRIPARGHPRPARTGLRLRSAPCLVGGHPSAPPPRVVRTTRAGRCRLPEVRPVALHCLRARPGNRTQHRVDSESSALARRLTDITKPQILGLVWLDFLFFIL